MSKWVFLLIVIIISIPVGGAIYEFTTLNESQGQQSGAVIKPTETTETSVRDESTTTPQITKSTQSPDLDEDNDGLPRDIEIEIGTDPTNPDTDGDRLLDGWEYYNQTESGTELPNSDPLRKDLYLHVFYTGDVEPLSYTEEENLRRIFSDMPVDNPRGGDGIRLHLESEGRYAGQLADDVVVFKSDLDWVSQYYQSEYMGPYTCVAHQVILLEIWNESFSGIGESPGYQSVVDGRLTNESGEYTIRVSVTTHEILHNIVDLGQFDHTIGGWLWTHGPQSWEYSDWTKNQYMSNSTESILDEEGFAGGNNGIC